MVTLPGNLKEAQQLDKNDPLSRFREHFVFPDAHNGQAPLYFAGHSLGLMPKKASQYVQQELDAWGKYAVEGHFEGKNPWLPYHENITGSFARLVGAKESEVVAMNTLTVNLHLLMVSFYRPTKERFKILIENNSFPSDKYAVDSQARFHGFDPKEAIVELKPSPGNLTVTADEISDQIKKMGNSLALVMLGNCNYLSGQKFDFKKITDSAQAVGAIAGFNLAHGAGNLNLKLHDDGVDFAVWCSYKYLNAGPGGIAGAFIHERHLGKKDIPRFEGWWGHNKTSRFKMGPDFDPLPTAEAWQLSNPPIWQLASLRASMELFDEATISALRERGDKLTAVFEGLIKTQLKDEVTVITPALPDRGSMLCLRFKKDPKIWTPKLRAKNVHVDFREPDIIRATPAPLYNSYSDVFSLVETFKNILGAE
ncbi:MAG: kynureninase [Bdellovibrionota bacterium]